MDVRYKGSKKQLLGLIEKPLKDNGIDSGVFLDVFCGAVNVSKHFKMKGFQIRSNDMMRYSYAFQRTYIQNNDTDPQFDGLKDLIPDPNTHNVISYLNKIPAIKGFMYDQFSMSGNSNSGDERNYFTKENASRMDAIRQKIQEWVDAELITTLQFYILMTSLIEGVSAVSNVTGSYNGYLKIDSEVMKRPMILEAPKFLNNNLENESFNEDAIDIAKQLTVDVAYLDPPYNQEQYASSYHIWETLMVWNQEILPNKLGTRDEKSKKSRFCSEDRCAMAFRKLIREINAKHILVSYSSDGIMSYEKIRSILALRGEVKIYTQIHKRFQSAERDDSKKDKLLEYLFSVKVED